MAEPIHITTAIFYCNAPPHVGSAYEALAADVYARYKRRACGKANVTFLTGTDEHGDKLKRAATAQAMEPKPFTDRMSAAFRKAWEGLNVSFDYFVRTTDPAHEKFVQQMLKRTQERGDIYFADYQGLYCVGCERFYTEKELLAGNLCPEHNCPVELISEGNYFLRLEKYRAQVREHIERNPDFIRPERYRNEALKMLAEPVSDLCISRPKSRLDWGVELPFDPNYVAYVWYDAFWAYFSAPSLDDPNFAARMLPYTEHFIGKDILKTHAVYWPAILLAAGMTLPRRLNVHGYLNFGGARMSKSSGNVADPVSYEKAFGPDVLRYFLMREVVFGLDGEFSEQRLIQRYNADLANDLGNLVSRVLSMASRYREGKVGASGLWALNEVKEQLAARGTGSVSGSQTTDELKQDLSLLEFIVALPRGSDLASRVSRRIEGLDFKGALEEIWLVLDAANRYIVATQPWTLAKDSNRARRLDQILANLIEALRVIGYQLEPFMPVTSRRLLDLLNVDEAAAAAPFGQGIQPDHRVKPPAALFPRIEVSK
jgi:methionyl-tRNA synthetase